MKLLGQLDSEKASHLERRELLIKADESRESAMADTSRVQTECRYLYA